MANDLTTMLRSNEGSRQIVPPAWTKLVSKASDIVRNQKANMKIPSPTQSPIQSPTTNTISPQNQRENNGEFDAVVQEKTEHEQLLKDVLILDEFEDVLSSESVSEVSPAAFSLLAHRLEEALREAKRDTLDLCEVLVPCDLITRISKDIVRMSDHEPCGLRGCLIVINLEEKVNLARKIGKLKIDRDTVATFELHLTLRKDNGNWLSLKQLLPSKLLKKIGRTPALIVSEAYTLNKKKLYRSSSRD